MTEFVRWMSAKKVRGGCELGEATVRKTRERLRREFSPQHARHTRTHTFRPPPSHPHLSLLRVAVFAGHVASVRPEKPPTIADVADPGLFGSFLDHLKVRKQSLLARFHTGLYIGGLLM